MSSKPKSQHELILGLFIMLGYIISYLGGVLLSCGILYGVLRLIGVSNINSSAFGVGGGLLIGIFFLGPATSFGYHRVVDELLHRLRSG